MTILNTRLVGILVLLVGGLGTIACKKSRGNIEIAPKKGSGNIDQSQGFIPWTDEQRARESEQCLQDASASGGAEAAKVHCQCVIDAAAAQWSYMDFSGNARIYVDEILASSGYKSCMSGAGADPSEVQVQVPDSKWEGAKPLEINNESSASMARLVMAPDGTGIMSYQQTIGGKNKLLAKPYTSLGWRDAMEVPLDNPVSGINRVEMGYTKSGEWVMVWEGGGLDTVTNKAYLEVVANTYTQKDGWKPASQFISNRTDPENESNLSVASNCGGDVITTWLLYDGGVYANRYTSASGWLGIAEVSGDVKVSSHTLACTPDGVVVAAWTQASATGGPFISSQAPGSNQWSAPEQRDADLKGKASSPQLALNAKGEGLLVWLQTDGTSVLVMGSVRSSEGKWEAAKALSVDIASQPTLPRVAIDQKGNFMVIWTHAALDLGIWGNYFSVKDAAWSGPVNINSANTQTPAKQGAVVFDQYGRAVAVWSESNGTADDILASRYEAGTWSKKQVIDAGDYGASEYLRLATDGRDTVIAVWKQDDGDRFNIYGNILKP